MYTLLLKDMQKIHTGDSSLHCPHRYCTVNPSDRKNRKYHYQKYISLPRVTATHFAKHFSLFVLLFY